MSSSRRPASYGRLVPACWLLWALAGLCLALACSSLARAQLFDLNEEPAPDDELEPPAYLSPVAAEQALEPEVEQTAPTLTTTTTPAPATKKYSWIRGTATRVVDAIKSTFSRMPRYFDFNQYVATFQRRYDPLEVVFRRAQFLGSCLVVFKARVAHRLGLASHRETVNKFSDRSHNEIKRMFMAAPPFEMRPPGQSEQDYYRELQQVAEEREQWDLELSSSAAADGSDPDEAPMVEEEQARRRIGRILEESGSDRKYEAALRDELEGKSQPQEQVAEPNPPRGGWRPLPWPGTSELPEDNSDNQEQQLALNANYQAPQLVEGDSLDWSKHDCFHKVYDQGEQCGKCYVLAATALVEFYKCSERLGRIQPRKFSTNYVLNCGQKFSPTIQGCRGGSLLDTLRFLALSGTHSIARWEEIRKERLSQHRKRGYRPDPLDKKCPLNRFEEPLEAWGSIRVELEPRLVHVNQWYEALQDGPLVASVQMPADVASYQAGTHEGFGCLGSGNWHAMLLVGYGTDFSGRPFWRFRNSWGPDWGDNGHFDMAMAVEPGCLAGGVRVYRRHPVGSLDSQAAGGDSSSEQAPASR